MEPRSRTATTPSVSPTVPSPGAFPFDFWTCTTRDLQLTEQLRCDGACHEDGFWSEPSLMARCPLLRMASARVSILRSKYDWSFLQDAGDQGFAAEVLFSKAGALARATRPRDLAEKPLRSFLSRMVDNFAIDRARSERLVPHHMWAECCPHAQRTGPGRWACAATGLVDIPSRFPCPRHGPEGRSPAGCHHFFWPEAGTLELTRMETSPTTQESRHLGGTDNDLASPEEVIAAQEQHSIVERALNALPPLQRSIAVAVLANGEAVRRVASRLQIGRTRVSRELAQAREVLHRELQLQLDAATIFA